MQPNETWRGNYKGSGADWVDRLRELDFAVRSREEAFARRRGLFFRRPVFGRA